MAAKKDQKAEKPKAPGPHPDLDKFTENFANAMGKAGLDGGKAHDEWRERRDKMLQDSQPTGKPYPLPTLNDDGSVQPHDGITPEQADAPKAKAKKPAKKAKKK